MQDVFYVKIPVKVKCVKNGMEEYLTADINAMSINQTIKDIFYNGREVIKKEMFEHGYTACSVTLNRKDDTIGNITIYALIISYKNGQQYVSGFEYQTDFSKFPDEKFMDSIRKMNTEYAESKGFSNIKVIFCQKEVYQKYFSENSEIDVEVTWDKNKFEYKETLDKGENNDA